MKVNTNGGRIINGNVNTGGDDFVASSYASSVPHVDEDGDQVYGDIIDGDKVEGIVINTHGRAHVRGKVNTRGGKVG